MLRSLVALSSLSRMSVRPLSASCSVRQVSKGISTPSRDELNNLFEETEASLNDVTQATTDTPAQSQQQQQYVRRDNTDPTAQRKKNVFSSGFGINRVDLMGGVASDPAQETTKSGSEYVNFRLFTNVFYRRADGAVIEQVEVHNVSAFGPQARYVKNNIEKGSRVFVSGRLHYIGGLERSDGSRSPRVAFVKAEVVQAIAKSNRREDASAAQ